MLNPYSRTSRAVVQAQHLAFLGARGTARKRVGGGWSGMGVCGDLATASLHVAESDVELVVGRWEVACDARWGVTRDRAVRYRLRDELVARSVDVDADV